MSLGAGDEIVLAERWLIGRLRGDTQMQSLVGQRIYSELVPAGTAYPFVVIIYQAGSDSVTANRTRIFTRMTYLVKAVIDQNSYTPIQPIVARIDALLQRVQDQKAFGRVLSCYRLRPFRLVSNEEDTVYRHLGGVYETSVQPLSA